MRKKRSNEKKYPCVLFLLESSAIKKPRPIFQLFGGGGSQTFAPLVYNIGKRKHHAHRKRE